MDYGTSVCGDDRGTVQAEYDYRIAAARNMSHIEVRHPQWF